MRLTIQKLLITLVTLSLLLLPVLPVYAQAEVIPATGELCAQGICNTIVISFPPNGGPVTGTLDGSGSKDGCTFVNSGTVDGTFAGGDGGIVTGTVVWTMNATCGSNSISETWNGTWQGIFRADGTGSGDGQVLTAAGTWQVSYSAEEFQRITTPITKEYFKQRFGIDIVDGTSKWTDHQLRLLDDLIRKLPNSYWDKTKFTRVIRDSVYIDTVSGASDPNVYGDYRYWERTIRVYDRATTPTTFQNDTEGDKEFIGTIVHEMTHAFHYYKDYKSVYETSAENSNSPIMNGFKVNSRDDPNRIATGWAWQTANSRWAYLGVDPNNQPVSDYARTVNPKEDLCESVMFYVVEPATLAEKSPQRYEFIKSQIFNNQEYPWDY